MGVQALGMGLGTLVARDGRAPRHRHRARFPRPTPRRSRYALVSGLMAAGMRVKDIGLALSPMAYFAQFALDCPCVAMVTASHNDNGWTGVKMGANRPLTFGPEEMGRLRDIVLAAAFKLREGGAYAFVEGFRRALHRRPDRPAEDQAQAEGRRGLRQRHRRRVRAAACWRRSAARSFRSTPSSTTPSRATIRTPRT